MSSRVKAILAGWALIAIAGTIIAARTTSAVATAGLALMAVVISACLGVGLLASPQPKIETADLLVRLPQDEPRMPKPTQEE